MWWQIKRLNKNQSILWNWLLVVNWSLSLSERLKIELDTDSRQEYFWIGLNFWPFCNHKTKTELCILQGERFLKSGRCRKTVYVVCITFRCDSEIICSSSKHITSKLVEQFYVKGQKVRKGRTDEPGETKKLYLINKMAEEEDVSNMEEEEDVNDQPQPEVRL